MTRSSLPAITHVDYSARIQTVDRVRSPRLHALLTEFAQQTGVPVLVNTSFNVNDEPIVCTPQDAYRCFLNTHIDYLVLGRCLLARTEQPAGMAESLQSAVNIPTGVAPGDSLYTLY